MEKFLARKNLILVGLFFFSFMMWLANYYAILPHRLAYLLYFFFFSISFSSPRFIRSCMAPVSFMVDSALTHLDIPEQSL